MPRLPYNVCRGTLLFQPHLLYPQGSRGGPIHWLTAPSLVTRPKCYAPCTLCCAHASFRLKSTHAEEVGCVIRHAQDDVAAGAG